MSTSAFGYTAGYNSVTQTSANTYFQTLLVNVIYTMLMFGSYKNKFDVTMIIVTVIFWIKLIVKLSILIEPPVVSFLISKLINSRRKGREGYRERKGREKEGRRKKRCGK